MLKISLTRNVRDMELLSCSHKVHTKVSVVATLKVDDDKVSKQVSSHGQLFQPY